MLWQVKIKLVAFTNTQIGMKNICVGDDFISHKREQSHVHKGPKNRIQCSSSETGIAFLFYMHFPTQNDVCILDSISSKHAYINMHWRNVVIIHITLGLLQKIRIIIIIIIIIFVLMTVNYR